MVPVVIGAGLAGLTAAAALRRRFAEVLVIERDELPDHAATRRGVPQGDQLHNLLSRAQVHLDELLPGFTDALVDAAAGTAAVAEETFVFELGRVMPQRSLDLRLLCAPRPVIEHVAREILCTIGGVRFQTGTSAVGLGINQNTVRGVHVERDAGRSTIDTQVVVDASGVGTRADAWLKDVGVAPAAVQTDPTDQWYVTSVYRRAMPAGIPFRSWMLFPYAGESAGALISPLGRDLWYASVSGRSGDPIPRTPTAVVDHCERLPHSAIVDFLRGAEWVEGPKAFRKRTASWRRYDLQSSVLVGFLALGDSVAALNPLFGQGISVAAWQAAELAALLQEMTPRELDLADITVRHHEKAAACAAAAWRLGQLVDETVGRSCGAVERLGAAIERDPATHRRYVGIWHLLEPAAALQDIRVRRSRSEDCLGL